MSVYNATDPVTSCALGEDVLVWNMETPAVGVTGAASKPVALAPLQGRHGFSVNGAFMGDPMGFQIDVQSSAFNSDTAYDLVPNGTITTSDPYNFSFSFYSPDTPTFVRLYMRNRGTAVNVVAHVTRY